MPPSKAELREHLRGNLNDTMLRVNEALSGAKIEELESIMQRLGRGSALPHWYAQLKASHTFPNLDGKTVGSVIEMILVAVLEKYSFNGMSLPPFKLNPARGVDLPSLDLGIKSPSTNFCTSEPFFSAYERLLGNEYDILVLLTDYQEAKSKPPLKIQIVKWRYLKSTEVADANLCAIAKKHREWLLSENEAWAKKVFRFLCYVNQSEWSAKYLLKLLNHLREEDEIRRIISVAEGDFITQNANRAKKDQEPIPPEELDAIKAILNISPLSLGVIDAADNWLVETQKELARLPNDNEWNRLLASPLDGKIGMSFALQWRFNFGRLFGE